MTVGLHRGPQSVTLKIVMRQNIYISTIFCITLPNFTMLNNRVTIFKYWL